MHVMITEWVKTALLPLTFPLIFPLHYCGHHDMESDPVKYRLCYPAACIAQHVLPAETVLDCGE